MPSGPTRRSRRTRGERPEIVPPKSDEEREDEEDDSVSEEDTTKALRGKRRTRTPTAEEEPSQNKKQQLKENSAAAQTSRARQTGRRRTRRTATAKEEDANSDSESSQSPSGNVDSSEAEAEDESAESTGKKGAKESASGGEDKEGIDDDGTASGEGKNESKVKRAEPITPKWRGCARRRAAEEKDGNMSAEASSVDVEMKDKMSPGKATRKGGNNEKSIPARKNRTTASRRANTRGKKEHVSSEDGESDDSQSKSDQEGMVSSEDEKSPPNRKSHSPSPDETGRNGDKNIDKSSSIDKEDILLPEAESKALLLEQLSDQDMGDEPPSYTNETKLALSPKDEPEQSQKDDSMSRDSADGEDGEKESNVEVSGKQSESVSGDPVGGPKPCLLHEEATSTTEPSEANVLQRANLPPSNTNNSTSDMVLKRIIEKVPEKPSSEQEDDGSIGSKRKFASSVGLLDSERTGGEETPAKKVKTDDNPVTKHLDSHQKSQKREQDDKVGKLEETTPIENMNEISLKAEYLDDKDDRESDLKPSLETSVEVLHAVADSDKKIDDISNVNDGSSRSQPGSVKYDSLNHENERVNVKKSRLEMEDISDVTGDADTTMDATNDPKSLFRDRAKRLSPQAEEKNRSAIDEAISVADQKSVSKEQTRGPAERSDLADDVVSSPGTLLDDKVEPAVRSTQSHGGDEEEERKDYVKPPAFKREAVALPGDLANANPHHTILEAPSHHGEVGHTPKEGKAPGQESTSKVTNGEANPHLVDGTVHVNADGSSVVVVEPLEKDIRHLSGTENGIGENQSSVTHGVIADGHKMNLDGQSDPKGTELGNLPMTLSTDEGKDNLALPMIQTLEEKEIVLVKSNEDTEIAEPIDERRNENVVSLPHYPDGKPGDADETSLVQECHIVPVEDNGTNDHIDHLVPGDPVDQLVIEADTRRQVFWKGVPVHDHVSPRTSLDLKEEEMPKLRRVKILLFSVGSRVHRSSKFEHVFSRYWDAVRLRLSTPLGKHNSAACDEAVSAFLVSKKLRKIHNCFVMGLLRKSTAALARRSEVAGHLPMKWKARVKVQALRLLSGTKGHTKGTSLTASLEMSGPMTSYVPQPAKGIPYKRPWQPEGEARETSIVSVDKSCSESYSATIPGSLIVEPVLRQASLPNGLEHSKNATWLLTVALREHTKKILKGAILHRKAMKKGEVYSQFLKYPNVLASNTKKDVKRRNDSTPALQHEDRKLRIRAVDIYSAVSKLPASHANSMGGAVSRHSLEQAYLSSIQALSPFATGRQAKNVQNFLSVRIDEIASASSPSSPRRVQSLVLPKQQSNNTIDPKSSVKANVAKQEPQATDSAPAAVLGSETKQKETTSISSPIKVPEKEESSLRPEIGDVRPNPSSPEHPTKTADDNTGKESTNNTMATNAGQTNQKQIAGVAGIGRGAKNLAAMMARTSDAKEDDDKASNPSNPSVDQNEKPRDEAESKTADSAISPSSGVTDNQADVTTGGKNNAEEVSAFTQDPEAELQSNPSSAGERGRSSPGSSNGSKGKSFGTKDLAAMRAKSSTEPDSQKPVEN